MPARVVLVHDDIDFVVDAAAALWAAGYDVAAFSGSMTALLALESAQRVELLITRITFPSGPNGVSLALVTKNKRPGLQVLFTARPENEPYTAGVGEFLPTPVNIGQLVDTVGRMLAPSDPLTAPEETLPGATDDQVGRLALLAKRADSRE